jgi:hypothetical protein
MNQQELDERWFSFQPIPGVAFGLNDAVRINLEMILESWALLYLFSLFGQFLNTSLSLVRMEVCRSN